MEKQDAVIRYLSLAFLAASAVAAFAVSLMGYTFATGELPFNLQPLLRQETHATPDAETKKQAPGAGENSVPHSEAFFERLYNELLAERRKLQAEREAVAEKSRYVEELAATTAELQKELAGQNERVHNLLIRVSEKERENAVQVSGLISKVDPKEAVQILLRMEEKTAAQVLSMMPPKTSGQLLGAMVKNGEQNSAERVARILETIKRFAGEEKS
jgi:flagellar motility protein MotE (MotC chaperone)